MRCRAIVYKPYAVAFIPQFWIYFKKIIANTHSTTVWETVNRGMIVLIPM
jgi:hypothetical protein